MASQGIGKFSFASAQTGVILQSQSENYTSSKAELTDYNGEFADVAYFEHKATIKLDTHVPVTSAYGESVGDTLTLANGLTDHLANGGGVSGGSIFVDSISRDKGNKEFEKMGIEGSYYPYI